MREKIKEIVAYLIKGNHVNDEEVINSYTDSIMFGFDQYCDEKVGNNVYLVDDDVKGITCAVIASSFEEAIDKCKDAGMDEFYIILEPLILLK